MSASLAASIQGQDEADGSSSDEAGTGADRQTASRVQLGCGATVSEARLQGMPRRMRIALGAVPFAVRCMFSPCLGLLLVGLADKLGRSEQGRIGQIARVALPQGNPFLHLAVVLQWAAPPAQTLVVCCARLGMSQVTGELAKLYVVLYIATMITVTGVSTAAMSIIF